MIPIFIGYMDRLVDLDRDEFNEDAPGVLSTILDRTSLNPSSVPFNPNRYASPRLGHEVNIDSNSGLS